MSVIAETSALPPTAGDGLLSRAEQLSLGLRLTLSLIAGGCLIPLGAGAYVFGLRQGKPPGYDADLLEQLLTGRHFHPAHKQPPHPLRLRRSIQSVAPRKEAP